MLTYVNIDFLLKKKTDVNIQNVNIDFFKKFQS